ncbi:hypothetical protein ACVWW4_008668 [Bradyrhizobium sp. LB7.1]
MPTPISSIVPVSAASPVADAATPDLVLQAGSVVDAKVVSVLAANLVRIAIANLSMDVMSEVALSPGQNLQLAVSQNDGTIRLAIMGGAGEAATDQVTLTPAAASLVDSPSLALALSASAARNTLTPLEQVAVTTASAEAVTKQGSQAPIFANLAAVVAGSDLPAGLKQAVLGVLAQQTPLDTGLDGGDIESAFQKSGLFLEASLAAGATPSSGTMPDLKAALLVLRQTLTTLEGAAIPAGIPGTPQAAVAPAPAAGEAAPTALPSTESDIAQPPRNANLAATILADIAGNSPQAAMPRTMTAGLAASLLQEITQSLPRMTGNVPGSNKAVPDGHVFEAASRATPPRRFAARCRRRNPLPRHHSHRIRRSLRPCIGCSTTPMLRSRARPCSRLLRSLIALTPAVTGSIRACRSGISRFPSQRRRAPQWRSSKSRATAAMNPPIPPSAHGARASRSMSSRPVPCML